MKKGTPFAAKRVLKFVALLALALPLALTSCSSESGSDDEEKWGEDYDPEFMKVCTYTAKTANQINDIYAECESIGELSEFEEEIRNMKYVEDVWFTNTTMFVDLKDYGTFMYSFYPKENSDSEEYEAGEEMVRRYATTRASDPIHPFLDLEKAVVINQLNKDGNMEKERNISELTIKMLSSCGIKCTPNNAPSIEFFRDGIFDYDIVFLITHGEWDKKRKVHWLLTSEEPTDASKFTPGDLYKHKDYPRNQVVWQAITELRNGGKKNVWYACISEKLIEASERSFSKKGKTIFFNVACQSLMGGNNNWSDHKERNYSLAEILKEKGVGAYFGYDESNAVGARAGFLFFGKMVSGMSVRNAYETLPKEYLHDNQSDIRGNDLFPTTVDFIADLLPYYSEYNTQIAFSRINGPSIGNTMDESDSGQLIFVLNATSPLFTDFNISYKSNAIDRYKNNFKYYTFRYGFEYATKEDFSDAVKTSGMAVDTKGCTLSANKVTFTQTLTSSQLMPSTTYYYRAYFYDGYDYYYSDSESFTTKDIPVDTGTQLPDVPGSDF